MMYEAKNLNLNGKITEASRHKCNKMAEMKKWVIIAIVSELHPLHLEIKFSKFEHICKYTRSYVQVHFKNFPCISRFECILQYIMYESQWTDMFKTVHHYY